MTTSYYKQWIVSVVFVLLISELNSCVDDTGEKNLSRAVSSAGAGGTGEGGPEMFDSGLVSDGNVGNDGGPGGESGDVFETIDANETGPVSKMGDATNDAAPPPANLDYSADTF